MRRLTHDNDMPDQKCERNHARDTLKEIAPIAQVAVCAHVAARCRDNVEANNRVKHKRQKDDHNFEQVFVGHRLHEVAERLVSFGRKRHRVIGDHMEAKENSERQHTADGLQLFEKVDPPPRFQKRRIGHAHPS